MIKTGKHREVVFLFKSPEGTFKTRLIVLEAFFRPPTCDEADAVAVIGVLSGCINEVRRLL